MGGRGGGRSFGPRINYEQFGLSKEDFAGTNVVPPPAYPARAPCPPPEEITPSVSYMLDVGASIKETIRTRMMAGEFSTHLGVPRELLGDGASSASKKKSKKKKKKKGKATMAHLDALAANEDDADSDAEKAEDDAESESGEERDSDDEDSEDSDDELDENNDYTHNYYDDEEQEDAGLSDEEYNEAMA